MSERRYGPRSRMLASGSLLLILLAAGFIVSGRIINRRATEMSTQIVTQVGEYHYHILRLEFGTAGQVLETAGIYLGSHPDCTEEQMKVLTGTLMTQNPEVTCIWVLSEGGHVRSYRRNGAVEALTPETDYRIRMASELLGKGGKSEVSGMCGKNAESNESAESETRTKSETPGKSETRVENETPGKSETRTESAESKMCVKSVRSRIIRRDTQRVWCIARRITDSRGRQCVCGAELPLPGISARMAEQNPFSRSYAVVYTPGGQIVSHPDPQMIGRTTTDTAELAHVREVAATGRQAVTQTFSQYLEVEEERIYYPLDVEGARWVAGIGIPRFNVEQQIEELHFYTVLTAVVAVLFFAALLIVAQRRWRREYELRLRSERESEQLHLQQVIEQIDPHFLFNSLNSLYSLIRSDPAQAREFTLTLSRVYRHVLERRREILSTVGDEVDFTWQYYSLQKIRFGDCILLTMNVNPMLRNHRIPAMSLQTLVENAVKHNRITEENPLHIRIYTEAEALVIENNYTAREKDDAESLGTGIERIRAVYRFHTEKNIAIEADGTVFRCRLPLLPPEN